MSFEPYPQSFQSGQLYESLLSSTYDQISPASLSYDLVRLHQEKDALSKGLADCVTYLRVLRGKLLETSHRLRTEPGLPRKKKKWLQQVKRHVDNEIKHRERDERAFLNNLQACETNIFLANTKAYQVTNIPFHAAEFNSTPTLYAPTLYSSYSGSEITDLTWDGWNDEAATSPFQKRSSVPFVIDDVAPDTRTEEFERTCAGTKEAKRPPPLCRTSVELTNSIPVPPNTAQSQFRRSSILDPEAATFEPTCLTDVQSPRCQGSNLKRLRTSSTSATGRNKARETRWFSTTGVVPTSKRSSVVGSHSSPEHLPGDMWCKSTPQLDPQRSAGELAGRQRANSL